MAVLEVILEALGADHLCAAIAYLVAPPIFRIYFGENVFCSQRRVQWSAATLRYLPLSSV